MAKIKLNFGEFTTAEDTYDGLSAGEAIYNDGGLEPHDPPTRKRCGVEDHKWVLEVECNQASLTCVDPCSAEEVQAMGGYGRAMCRMHDDYFPDSLCTGEIPVTVSLESDGCDPPGQGWHGTDHKCDCGYMLVANVVEK